MTQMIEPSKKTMGWRKSTRCESHTCIEVRGHGTGRAEVRDGKLQAASPILSISRSGWAAFLSTL